MKMNDVINIKIKVDLKLWSAIKLRIAGMKYLHNEPISSYDRLMKRLNQEK